MSVHQSRKFSACLIAKKTALAGGLLVALSACTLTGPSNPVDGIGFREKRFDQVMKLQEFQACKDQGLRLDAQARSRNSAGAYLSSARILEACESGLSGDTTGIPEAERMRVYSLSIQNYFKGGDLESARRNLDTYNRNFGARDLYYADGSSFAATMAILLGRAEPSSYGQFAVLNVSDGMKLEMRRYTHWKNK